MIEELRAADVTGDEERRHRSVRRLSELADVAIPAIRTAMSNSQGIVRMELLCAIGGMDGDEAASALLEVAMAASDEGVQTVALNFLANRPIKRPLIAGEKAALVELVSQSSALRAATASLVLAKCTAISGEERARVIVPRFLRAVSEPSQPLMGGGMGSSLSAEASELTQFVLALEAIQSPNSVLERLKEGSLTYSNEKARKWSLVAQGFMGSSEVAAELQELVEKESDLSLQALTLRAYARSAKYDAIPLLERYLEERTSSKPARPVMLHTSGDPLEDAARGELFRLRREGGP